MKGLLSMVIFVSFENRWGGLATHSLTARISMFGSKMAFLKTIRPIRPIIQNKLETGLATSQSS